MNRKAMIRRVQIEDFALFEAHLFLDTHPTDADAQAYYRKHLAQAKAAREEYEAKYGPLEATSYTGGNWNWIDDPWPWENMEEE